MIIPITHPAKLQGAIAAEMVKCMERYCEKAKDGVAVEDLAQIIDERVFATRTAEFFLGLDDKLRVCAFAITRVVFDYGLGTAGDLWHIYIDPKAPPGLFEEGLQTIKDSFTRRGITRLQFSSRRNAEDGKAWERLLRGCGFKPVSVTFEMEVPNDGKPENRPG
jgi:hypothetical protein